MLAKAAGGSSVPKFIKDTGNESLIQAFKFLGSDQMTGQGSELLFVEKYGETLYREAGFTETAEKINGRLAQVGFVLALQNTFNGDVLTLMAKYPLLVSLVVIGIAMSVVFLLMVAFLGGTPGKLMLGLRITHEDGATTPPGLGKALLRSIPGFLAALPVIGQVIAILVPIAALVMVINDRPERRSVYDRIAGTRVVRKASLPD